MSIVALRTPLTTAFGPEAERIAGRCSANTPILFCDGTHVAEALAEAVRRRREGDAYLVAPLLHDSLSLLSREAARAIFTQFDSPDQRRELFEGLSMGVLHLNGSSVSQQSAYHPAIEKSMREISQFGDGLYVRSTTERMRLEATLTRKRLHVAVAPLIDDTVPNVHARAGATRVVVWAPNEDAEQLCVFSYALWDLKMPAIFVCQGFIPGAPQVFLSPDRAEEALLHAAVIVDTQISDPGTAIAFAGRGFAIASAVTSGAHEFVSGTATYHPHDFASISAAVSRARSSRNTLLMPVLDVSNAVHSTITAAQPILPPNPPLVSLVIPTYNRRRELRATLDLLSKQAYPNFEIIVVNDCGEDVSDIAAEYPITRYLCTPQNGGAAKAANHGLRASRGEFVGVVADDDCNYPAHIASLVSALIGSGVDVAHGNIVLRLDTKLPDGRPATYGYSLEHDGDHDSWCVYWGMPIHAQGYLIRRSAFARIGFLDDRYVCASDHDCSIRLSKNYDFVHVPCVTGEMSYRDDKSNLSSSIGGDLAVEIETMLMSHAPSDSAIISSRIEQTIRGVAAAAVGSTFFAPAVRLADPIPLFTTQ